MGDTSSTATTRPPLVGGWVVDTRNSSVGFTVRNMGLLRAKGTIPVDGATVDVDLATNKAEVSVRLDVSRFDTGNTKRDEHVRGSDFLDVEGFPYMSFRSVDLRFHQQDPASAELDGELTVRGVTRLVTLSVRCDDVAPDNGATASARVRADAVVRRSDFGVTAMRGMVGEKIRVHIALTLRRSDTATGRADDEGSPE
jgi:polyisoprenoid-binding protein YceI